MLFQTLELALLLLLSLISDLRCCRIRNCITLPFAALGVVTNTAFREIPGLSDSVAGLFLPLFLLIPLYALRMLGAGDVKLFGAAGAIMGLKFVLHLTLAAFLAGGFIGIILLIHRKNAAQRFGYLWTYLKYCVLTHSLQIYDTRTVRGGKGSFRFTYAVVPAALFLIIKSNF